MTGKLFDLKGRRVLVTGHRGMVGSALVRRLATEACEVLTIGRDALDLRDQAGVHRAVAALSPDVVIIAAARVGGIVANDRYPADFLYDNLMIEANLIQAAHLASVAKLLFLGSSCIYPEHAPQPLREESLLTGALQPTNEWYAIAKIAGIKLCDAYRRQYGRDFISAMPCNLYGPNDYFDPERSHVIPGLLRRFHEATVTGAAQVVCWGTGAPRREFLHVDDLADACIFLLRHYSGEGHVNVGTGEDIAIRDLVEMVRGVTGYRGQIAWDSSRPDGTMLKRMDVGRMTEMGWSPRIPFAQGLAETYRWFAAQEQVRG